MRRRFIALIPGAFLIFSTAIMLAADRPAPARGKANKTPPVKIQRGYERTRNLDYGVYKGWGRDTGGAVRLVRANELRQVQDRNGELTILDWDVKIIQDSLTIWCDKAKYWKNLKRLELINNVIMIDPVRSLRADRVTYYEDRKKTIARGNVEVERDSVLMNSRNGEYSEQIHTAHVSGDMKVRDLRRDIILTGGDGVFETERNRVDVTLNPVLVQLDSTGGEKVRIVSERMIYDGRSGFAEARKNVILTSDKIRGTCGRMFYYPDSAKVLMLEEPVVLQGRDEARGDSIWIYLVEDQLDSVEILGNAIAYTAADTAIGAPRNKMTGKRIVMDFDNGEVIRMESRGQTVAIYHLFEKGVDKGSNKVSGDEITLYFTKGELMNIEVIGGARGTYYPARLAEKVRSDE